MFSRRLPVVDIVLAQRTVFKYICFSGKLHPPSTFIACPLMCHKTNFFGNSVVCSSIDVNYNLKMKQIEKAIQFLVNPQKDFIGRMASDQDGPPSNLHVGKEAVTKLRGNGESNSVDPFVETTKLLFDSNRSGTEKVSVVLDEDWHNSNEPEFMFSGRHCVKGTDGAKLVGDLDLYRWEENVHVLRANSLNVGAHPHYGQILKTIVGDTEPTKIRVGVYGVWTSVKVEYLLLNLQTLPPKFPPTLLGVCEPLTAAPDKKMHEAALEKLEMLGVQIFYKIPAYLEWLGIAE